MQNAAAVERCLKRKCYNGSDKPGYCKRRCSSCQYDDMYQKRVTYERECDSGFLEYYAGGCYKSCPTGTSRDASDPSLCVPACPKKFPWRCNAYACAESDKNCGNPVNQALISQYSANANVLSGYVFQQTKLLSNTPSQTAYATYSMKQC